jgi:8-oxo-dGTP diphosphatase
MELKSTLINRAGQKLDIVYREADPLSDLGDTILQGVHAFCFCGDKLVLVKHPKSGWMPPGGGIEQGETYEKAVIREVKEETNMNVAYQELIGYQDIYEPDRIIRQTRSFCMVEPIGEFTADPDDEISEIKLIDPKEYKQYFDWGEIGERIMQRALEIRERGTDDTI